MGRAELGTKWACVGCAERFYDLCRTPPTCPKCGTKQPPPPPRMTRPGRRPVEVPRAAARIPVEVADIEEVEADDDNQEAILDPDDGDDESIVEEIGIEPTTPLS